MSELKIFKLDICSVEVYRVSLKYSDMLNGDNHLFRWISVDKFDKAKCMLIRRLPDSVDLFFG